MSDLAARRERLFGIPKQDAPPTDMGSAIEVLAQRVNELQAANALLSDSLAAANGALAGATAEAGAQRARADVLQEQLALEQAECAGLVQSIAMAAQSQPAPIEMPEPVDTAAIVAAVVAALPAPVAVDPPEPPAVIKSWLLESRDSMGNQKQVRMTPEY